MKRSLSLILTLLLLLPVALAEPEEFTLRDGVTWSSTPEEVEAFVGDLSWSEKMSGGLGGLVQAYSNVSFGNCSGEFQAIFVGDTTISSSAWDMNWLIFPRIKRSNRPSPI